MSSAAHTHSMDVVEVRGQCQALLPQRERAPSMHGEVRGQNPSGASPPTLYEAGSVSCTHQASENSFLSASYLTIGARIIDTCVHCFVQLHMGSGDMNAGLCT